MSRPDRSGRGWAYVGVVLGSAVSIAANVAASFIPPADAPAGWMPNPGAVVSAVFWPLLVLVAVELFARVRWPAGWRWLLLRAVGLLPVAVIAAVVSYRHLSALLRFYGEDPVTAALGPLAVDGCMVMAAGALIASGRPRTPAVDAASPSGAVRGQASTDRTSPGHRSDADLIAAVKRLPRRADGTVPVRRAARALGTGPDRARRLLRQAGLLHAEPVPVRVPDPPIAAAIDPPEGDAR